MKSSSRYLTRTRQTGQATQWFLATAAASCCALALLYNVGQVATKRKKR